MEQKYWYQPVNMGLLLLINKVDNKIKQLKQQSYIDDVTTTKQLKQHTVVEDFT